MYRRLMLPAMMALFLVFSIVTPSAAATSRSSRGLDMLVPGPGQHYLALGDSLAFGYQPDGDYTHGYVADFYADLASHGVQDVTDLGCPGETSTTMITGGCPYAPQGTPPQLEAAIAYLSTHPGTVSPVTLDIGANDLLKDANYSTCTVNVQQFNQDLNALDLNLRVVILPLLHAALTIRGHVTGALLMMNYYDVTQNICPNLLSYTQTLNAHLASDLQGYGTLVDVFGAFGGTTTPNPNLCTYTWICSNYHDIHATTLGYSVIAQAFEQTAGY